MTNQPSSASSASPNPPQAYHTLTKLPPRKRMEALLDRPDACKVIQNLEPYNLYHLIQEIGASDATDLALLASPQQVQGFLDLDSWRRDEIVPGRIAEWLELYMRLEDKDFAALLQKIDEEPILILLQEHLQVFISEEKNEIPPILLDSDVPYETLDGVFFLVFSSDENATRLVRNFLKRLYTIDVTLAHRILRNAHISLHSQLSETAYHMRSARMDEIGFVPFDDALRAYAWRDPLAARTGVLARAKKLSTPTTTSAPELYLPDLYQRHSPARDFLAQAWNCAQNNLGLEPQTLQTLEARVLILTNMVCAADRVEPRDRTATVNVHNKVRGLLSLALEFLAHRNTDTAGRILASSHPTELFQLGYSLTVRLAAQARALLHEGVLPHLTLRDDQPLSLLSPPDRLLVQGLLEPRPSFAPRDLNYTVPFENLDQLEEAAARLSLVAYKITATFGLLGLTHDTLTTLAYQEQILPPVEQLTLDTLLSTFVVTCTLSPQTGFLHPLNRETLAQAIEGPLQQATQTLQNLGGTPRREAWAQTDLFQTAQQRLISPIHRDPASAAIAGAFWRNHLERLLEEFAALSPAELRANTLELHFLGPHLLLQTPSKPTPSA